MGNVSRRKLLASGALVAGGLYGAYWMFRPRPNFVEITETDFCRDIVVRRVNSTEKWPRELVFTDGIGEYGIVEWTTKEDRPLKLEGYEVMPPECWRLFVAVYAPDNWPSYDDVIWACEFHFEQDFVEAKKTLTGDTQLSMGDMASFGNPVPGGVSAKGYLGQPDETLKRVGTREQRWFFMNQKTDADPGKVLVYEVLLVPCARWFSPLRSSFDPLVTRFRGKMLAAM
ncbi:MAG: hypothetical protein JNL58_07715 [Planctomyces sp.]|nr:hypothetical protein [Planctomyces sp.]